MNIKKNKKKHTTKLITTIVMILISVLLILLTSKIFPDNLISDNKSYSIDGFYFDTYVKITIYNCEENKNVNIKSEADFYSILDKCLDICKKYELICSPTNKESELFQLNNNPDYISGKDVYISDELSQIINKSIEISKPFSDKFSIYSGDLCALWDFNKKNIPSALDIEKALENLSKKNTSITLGATAKGYIADKIRDYLVETGINEAIIDLGGNIVVIGDKYNDSQYTIGIKRPFDDSENPIVVCKLSSKSIVTSGIYERYFELNDIIYHHIIDITTGYPADTDVLSVTIIGDSSIVTDCYSTCGILYGKDYILSIINSKKYEDVECIIIDSNYNVILSNGLKYEDEYIVMKD